VRLWWLKWVRPPPQWWFLAADLPDASLVVAPSQPDTTREGDGAVVVGCRGGGMVTGRWPAEMVAPVWTVGWCGDDGAAVAVAAGGVREGDGAVVVGCRGGGMVTGRWPAEMVAPAVKVRQ
nr:hypothetical protein [Tanacetum cinerariifolium]